MSCVLIKFFKGIQQLYVTGITSLNPNIFVSSLKLESSPYLPHHLHQNNLLCVQKLNILFRHYIVILNTNIQQIRYDLQMRARISGNKKKRFCSKTFWPFRSLASPGHHDLLFNVTSCATVLHKRICLCSKEHFSLKPHRCE